MSHDAYSALSDPTRRRILDALRGGPLPVGRLVTDLEVSQPTVSKHLKVLRDAGMVTTRAQGQKRFYRLVPEPLGEVAAWLGALMAAAREHEDDAAAAPLPSAPDTRGGSLADPQGESDAAAPSVTEDADRAPEEPLDAPAGEVEDSGEESGQPSRGEAPDSTEEVEAPAAPREEKALPWFTAQVTEITKPQGGDVVVPEDAVAETAPEEDPQPRNSAGADDRSSLPRAAADGSEELSEPDVVAPDPEESQVTGDSLGADVHAAPGARTEAAVDAQEDAAPRDTAPHTVPPETLPSEGAEDEEQWRPRGGAHRRQSGLLSTLTGLRRRGRGTRRG